MATPRKKQTEKNIPEKHHNRKEQHLAHAEAKQRNILVLAAAVVGIIIAVIIIIGLVDALWVTPNKVIAVVGDEEITVKEYQVRTRYYRWMLLNEYVQINQILQYFGDYDGQQLTRAQSITETLGQPELLAPEVLNMMIEEIIIANKAEELGIVVDEAAVELAMQEGFGFYANGTPTPQTETGVVVEYPTLDAQQAFLVTATPSEEDAAATQQAFATALAITKAAESENDETEEAAPTETPQPTATPADEQTSEEVPAEATPVPSATPYTVEVYEENYAEYVDKLNLAKVDENAFREIQFMNQLRSQVYAAVTADVPAEDEQVWVRHILTNDETVAASALGMLESGEMGFAELARMFSSDGSAEQGGDLGWFGRGTMVAEFEEAAFSMTEIGQIVGPVETQFGYHVLQLLGRDVLPLAESDLATAKSNYFTTWLADQRSSLEEQGLLTINAAARDRYAPSEPSFNDPKIYEALFGISQRDAQSTSSAYQTEQAVMALTPSATAEPVQ